MKNFTRPRMVLIGLFAFGSVAFAQGTFIVESRRELRYPMGNVCGIARTGAISEASIRCRNAGYSGRTTLVRVIEDVCNGERQDDVKLYFKGEFVCR